MGLGITGITVGIGNVQESLRNKPEMPLFQAYTGNKPDPGITSFSPLGRE